MLNVAIGHNIVHDICLFFKFYSYEELTVLHWIQRRILLTAYCLFKSRAWDCILMVSITIANEMNLCIFSCCQLFFLFHLIFRLIAINNLKMTVTLYFSLLSTFYRCIYLFQNQNNITSRKGKSWKTRESSSNHYILKNQISYKFPETANMLAENITSQIFRSTYKHMNLSCIFMHLSLYH